MPRERTRTSVPLTSQRAARSVGARMSSGFPFVVPDGHHQRVPDTRTGLPPFRPVKDHTSFEPRPWPALKSWRQSQPHGPTRHTTPAIHHEACERGSRHGCGEHSKMLRDIGRFSYSSDSPFNQQSASRDQSKTAPPQPHSEKPVAHSEGSFQHSSSGPSRWRLAS